MPSLCARLSRASEGSRQEAAGRDVLDFSSPAIDSTYHLPTFINPFNVIHTPSIYPTMATSTTGHAVVVTVTATPTDAVSSTMSLIYIYSAATTEAQPTPTSSSTSSHHLAGGAIAGIIIGCFALLILLALGLFCYSRRIARKRRGQRVPPALRIPPSERHILPSRTQSHDTTAVNSPTMQQLIPSSDRDGDSNRNNRNSRSQQHTLSSPRTPRSARHHPRTPPHPDRPELEGSRPKMHEVYGSYLYPAELQAGSLTNLVAEVAQIQKAKAMAKTVTTSITRRERGDSDSNSTGYLSPTWPPPSRGGTVSELEMTDHSTIRTTHDGDYGYTEGDRNVQSIHVYFSPGSEYGGSSPTATDASAAAAALSKRQSQIVLAMSQAASSPTKASRSVTTVTR